MNSLSVENAAEFAQKTVAAIVNMNEKDQNSRNLLRISNFVERQVSKTNNRENLHNSTLYNERVTSVRWQKHHFHTLYCY